MIETQSDVKQGAFGDSWFIGGLVIISSNEEYIKQLIVDADHFDMGFVTIQFFINGEWVQVTVDTLLPYENESKTLWFHFFIVVLAKMETPLNSGSVSLKRLIPNSTDVMRT